jgi:hypothetical protein
MARPSVTCTCTGHQLVQPWQVDDIHFSTIPVLLARVSREKKLSAGPPPMAATTPIPPVCLRKDRRESDMSLARIEDFFSFMV